MRKIHFLSFLVCVSLFSGCSHDTTTTPVTPVTIDSPRSVTAQTVDSTSIRVSWVRGQNDNKADTVVVFTGGQPLSSSPVPSPEVTTIITELHAGLTYILSVHGAGGASASIPWVITPVTPTTNPPSNVMALSKNTSTISITWTRDGNDHGVDSVIVTGTSTTTSIPVASASVLDITNLSPGTVYSIRVRNAGGSSSSVSWMTASRANGIKIYQLSASNGAGIDLKDGAAVTATSANQNVLDLVLDDVESNSAITTPSGLAIESPSILNSGWRSSFISSLKRYALGGLDNDYSASDFSADQNDMLSNQFNAFQIPDDATDYRVKGDRILLVATKDGNLAKVDIVPDPTTGKLYSGTSHSKYITVNISYQTVPSKPYAARPRPRSGQREPLKSIPQ